MILTSILCSAICLYHESRSTSIAEQQQVAQVLQNRSKQQNKPICKIALDQAQFSWAKSFKPKYRFRKSNEMLKYYKIEDGNSWITALGVASMSNLPTSDVLYYHDKRINKFAFNDKLTMVNKTKNFIFYKDKL
jgi:hypothetical protein